MKKIIHGARGLVNIEKNELQTRNGSATWKTGDIMKTSSVPPACQPHLTQGMSNWTSYFQQFCHYYELVEKPF